MKSKSMQRFTLTDFDKKAVTIAVILTVTLHLLIVFFPFDLLLGFIAMFIPSMAQSSTFDQQQAILRVISDIYILYAPFTIGMVLGIFAKKRVFYSMLVYIIAVIFLRFVPSFFFLTFFRPGSSPDIGHLLLGLFIFAPYFFLLSLVGTSIGKGLVSKYKMIMIPAVIILLILIFYGKPLLRLVSLSFSKYK